MSISVTKMLHIITWISFLLYVETTVIVDRLEWLSGEESEIRESASRCVFDVSKEHFMASNAVAFSLSTTPTAGTSFATTDTILLSKLHGALKWNILVHKSNAKKHQQNLFYKKIDSYILQIRNHAEFNTNLEQLVQLSSWNPHAKFLIFLNQVVPNVDAILSFFIQELWHYRAVNVVIITHSPENPLNLLLHSWYPYTCGSCDQLCDKPVLVGKCGRNGKVYFNRNLYANKIPNNIQGCTFKVLVRIWPPFVVQEDETKRIHGMEINLLEMIAQSLNFTMSYIVFDEDDDFENFNYRMKKERVDIGIGAIAIGSADESLDYTHSYMVEQITWCVPGALVVPRWKNLITIFQMHIWILLFLALCIVAFFIYVVVNKQPFEFFASYNSFFGAVLNLWVILLGFVVNIKFKKHISRFIIFLWIIFSLITNCAYQSSLISVLTEPNYEKQIETVDEIFAENYTFGIQKSFRRFLNSTKTLDIPIENCEKINACFHKVVRDRNIVVATSRLYYEYYAKRFTDKYHHRLLHALSEDLISYPIEMIAAKGFPLLQKINLLLLKIREAGFLNLWRRQELRKNLISDDDDNYDFIDNGLSLFQMQGAFLGLGFGLLFSLLMFIFEIFTIHN